MPEKGLFSDKPAGVLQKSVDLLGGERNTVSPLVYLAATYAKCRKKAEASTPYS